VVSNRRVAGVGERESTWGARMREPDDLVLSAWVIIKSEVPLLG
jgi:hypothetical protein